MHPVFFYIESFFALGIAGTFLANRNATAEIKKERWKKLVVHCILVNLLAACITEVSAALPFVLAGIVLTGFYEMFLLTKLKKQDAVFYFLSFLTYTICVALFICFNIFENTNTVCFVFLLVFTFDGFSQVTGQLFGKTKLFPNISPGKTWEGLAGGSFFALLTAFLIRHWLVEANQFVFISITAVIIILAAVAGDWLASYFKRKHAVKDFSNFIPGHGGFLDRFDSWIFAGAACAVLFNSWIDFLLSCFW